MSNPQIGQQVITPTGVGTVDTITAGNADADILRYRITSTLTTRRRWYYLDEICCIDHASANQ
jgi:hypothetical protein